MDDSFYIEFEQVSQCVEDMQRANAQIQAQIEALETNVKNNLNEQNWTLSTQQIYQGYQQTWTNETQRMSTDLAAAQTALTNIAEGYGMTEQQCAQMWGSMTI